MCSSIALYIRTGTFTSPKEIEPDQIARGMGGFFPCRGGAETYARKAHDLPGLGAPAGRLGFRPGRRAASICDEKTRDHPDDPDRRPRRALYRRRRAYFIPWLPDAASEEAGEIDAAYWFVAIICALIFALVAGVAIYAGWKFRAREDDPDDGSPIHGHTGLEIWWTAIPAALVVAMSVFSAVALAQIDDLPDDHGTIDVTSQQFAWSFTYPDQDGRTTGELVLLVDEPVMLNLDGEGRHPLVLGARVPHEAGRGARAS